MNIRDEKRLGWMASIWIHIILITVFFLYKMEMREFDLATTPISFMPASGVRSGGSILPELGGARPLIELPKRPRLDEVNPLINRSFIQRQPIEAPIPNERPATSSSENILSGRRVNLTSPDVSPRQRAKFNPIEISDGILSQQVPDAVGEKIAGDELFSIVWDGTPRNKISGELPEFPKGTSLGATVKIDFEVSPSGDVTYASLATKGLPDLDRASIEAVRTWRFNPLDKSEKQVKQNGSVTFIYKLK